MINRLFRISIIGITYLYLYIPIIILIVNSFNSSRFGIIWSGFTINWYKLLMSNESLLQATKHSLILAIFSATCSTFMGLFIASILRFSHVKYVFFIKSVLLTVMILPDIVIAISLLVLFISFGIQLGFTSLFFSHIILCLPFVVVTVFSNLTKIDIHVLEAARDLGANEITILRKIIFPLTIPSVSASWLLSFTLSIDDVVVSSFVNGPEYDILPLQIYSMIKIGISPEINALATMLLFLSVILVIFSQFINRDKIIS